MEGTHKPRSSIETGKNPIEPKSARADAEASIEQRRASIAAQRSPRRKFDRKNNFYSK